MSARTTDLAREANRLVIALMGALAAECEANRRRRLAGAPPTAREGRLRHAFRRAVWRRARRRAREADAAMLRSVVTSQALAGVAVDEIDAQRWLAEVRRGALPQSGAGDGG